MRWRHTPFNLTPQKPYVIERKFSFRPRMLDDGWSVWFGYFWARRVFSQNQDGSWRESEYHLKEFIDQESAEAYED